MTHSPSAMIRSFRSDHRHHSFSSHSSASSSDDDDAITPVEIGAEVDTDADSSEPECLSAQLTTASCSSSSPSNSTADTAHLWRRMLALQRRFHCYNSARISAALESELVEAVVPPRACLDLLNDSVTAQQLPDEARREVAAMMSGHAGALYEAAGCDFAPKLAAVPEMAARPSKTQSRVRQRRRRGGRQHR